MKSLTFNSINCPTGNCHTSPELWAGKSVDITDLDIQDSDHPNLAPFKGTLLLLDEPSNQPPHGSDGHRIFVPTRVAEKRLATLPGMGINYQDDLEGHNPTEKIGVISKSWVEGKKVKVSGVIWKKDFPEALRKFRMNKGRLGMSMELGDVYVRDKDEDVWHLEDFHFTGATVLRKDHAAYENTEMAASRQYFVNALAAARSAVQVIQGKRGKPEMADEKKKKQQTSGGQALVTAISAAIAKENQSFLKTFAEEQKKTNTIFAGALKRISESQEELVKGLNAMATGNIDAEVEDEEVKVEEVEAGASNPSDASMSSARKDATDPTDATDSTDATDVDAGVDPTNFTSSDQDDTGSGATPGDLNPNTDAHYKEQSKGPASSRIQRTGKDGPSRGIAASRERDRGTEHREERGTLVAKSMAAARVIRTLTAQNKELKETNKRFQNRVSALEASVERYAERVERKTITPEIASLLEKGGHDIRELMASKTKLTVAEVDDLFLKANIQLEPTMRAAFKNQLFQAGLMEEGRIQRWPN